MLSGCLLGRFWNTKIPPPQEAMNVSAPLEEEEDEIIYLNVGGYHYTTTRDTLTQKLLGTPDHVLSSMLNNAHSIPLLRDKDGRVFIDRDGQHFKYLLNYLRVGGDLEKCVFPWHNEQLMSELELEAQFFGFTSLVHFFQSGELSLLPEDKKFDIEHCSSNLKLSNGEKTVEKLPFYWKTVRCKHPLFTLPQHYYQQPHLAHYHTSKNVNPMINQYNAKLFNYYEVLIEETSNSSIFIGIMSSEANIIEKNNSHLGIDMHSYAFNCVGRKAHPYQTENYGLKCETGDRVGMWFNVHERSLYFYKNGVSMSACFRNIPLTKRRKIPKKSQDGSTTIRKQNGATIIMTSTLTTNTTTNNSSPRTLQQDQQQQQQQQVVTSSSSLAEQDGENGDDSSPLSTGNGDNHHKICNTTEEQGDHLMDVSLRYYYAISLNNSGDRVTLLPFAQHPEL